jgi:hypothetical protein
MKRVRSLVIGTVLFFMSSNAAYAEFGFIDYNSISIEIGRELAGTVSLQDIKPGPGRSTRAMQASRSSQYQAKPYVPTSTRFVSSPTQSKKSLANFVIKTRQNNPELAAALQNLIDTRDAMADIAQLIAPYNLKTNDLSDAMTVYLVLSHRAINGNQSILTQQSVRSVRRQSAVVISGIPLLAKITDIQKQAVAEFLLISGVMADAATIQARQEGLDSTLRVADTVRKSTKASFGIDLQDFNLTDAGFVKK